MLQTFMDISNIYVGFLFFLKTKTMAFRGKNYLRSRIVINNSGIEEVTAFNYFGWNFSYTNPRDVDIKVRWNTADSRNQQESTSK